MSAKQPLDQPTALIGSWPGLVLLAAAAVASLNLLTPLVTPRPRDGTTSTMRHPISPRGTAATYARLWEDPLGTVYTDAQRERPAVPRVLPSPLAELVAVCRQSPQKKAVDQVRRHMKAVGKTIEARSTCKDRPAKLLCLSVFVSGAPYADDRERRMRTRYAVHAALAAHGYKLLFPKQLTYVEIPLAVHVETDAANDFQARQVILPLKLFVRDDLSTTEPEKSSHPEKTAPDGVLVLWIDQDQLGSRPLTSLAQILEVVFPECEFPNGDGARMKVDLAVVGPADSDGLLQMARENERWLPMKRSQTTGPVRAPCDVMCGDDPSRWCCEDSSQLKARIRRVHERCYFSARFPNSTVFSCRATVWPGVLGTTGQRQIDLLLNGSTPLPGGGSDWSSCGLKFIPMIGTDDQLAAALRHELMLRDAWPGQERDGVVVLVTERDTLYGRAFPGVFTDLLKQDGLSTENSLVVIKYLRGTDGKTTEAQKQQPSNSEPNRSAKESNALADLPSGASQLDYLRRLQTQLVQLRNRLEADGGRQILAIGVVGSDVFDKLLVLRALHKEFGQALFFTTDLEAHYAHQDEYPFARNLLVATHYGLQLHPNLQADAPPFRDSYQTATFLTIRRVLNRELFGVWGREDFSPWRWPCQASRVCDAPREFPGCLRPLVYEVGRSGPYQLTITGGNERTDAAEGSPSVTAAVQPLSPRDYPWLESRWRVLLWAALVLLLVLVLVARPVRRLLFPSNRPDCWWIWGGLAFLATCGIALAVVARGDHFSNDGEPVVLLEGISVWPVTFLRFTALAVATICLISDSLKLWRNRREQVETQLLGLPDEKQHRDASLGVPSATATGIDRPIWSKICAWLRALLFCDAWEMESERAQSGLDTWRRYRYFGAVRRRVLRISTASVLYFIVGRTVFRLFPSPHHDCRGAVSHFLENWTLKIAVVALIALIFFVIDEILLCTRLVRNLQSSKIWPASAQRRIGRGDGYPSWIADELITARLIETRTNVSGMLLAGPFIVILLLLAARSGLLEYSGFPLPLVFVIGLTLIGLLGAYLAQRNTAGHVRGALVARLQDRAAIAAAGQRKIEEEQCRAAAAEIGSMHRGAFRPFQQDPLLTAIAIPLGGAGGLALLSYLLSTQ